MNVLVLTNEIYPFPSANGVCVNNIIKSIKDNCRIFVLSTNRYLLCECETVDGIYIERMDFKYHGRKKNFFTKSWSFIKWLFAFNVSKKMIKEYEIRANRLIEEKGIDEIIAFNRPFESAYASVLLKKRYTTLKIVNIFLDLPGCIEYRTSIVNKIIRHSAMRLIKKVMRYSDNVVFMKYGKRACPSIYNGSFPLNTVFLDVPCFSPCVSGNLKNSKTIVYTGLLDGNYRNPSQCLPFLMQLIADCELGYFVKFYGTGCEELLNDIEKKYPAHFKYYGQASAEEIRHINEDAAVFLNISNKGIKQLPSKIFTYFSTGKPVLNFYFDDDDISLPYFDEYPNHLSVPIKNMAVNKNKIVNFLNNYMVLSDASLSLLFRDNTPDAYKKYIL